MADVDQWRCFAICALVVGFAVQFKPRTCHEVRPQDAVYYEDCHRDGCQRLGDRVKAAIDGRHIWAPLAVKVDCQVMAWGVVHTHDICCNTTISEMLLNNMKGVQRNRNSHPAAALVYKLFLH